MAFSGLAQKRNPAYDEWQRKERLKDSLRKAGTVVPGDGELLNDAIDLTAGVGVMTVLSGVNYNVSGPNGAKGRFSTYGAGPFASFSIGNMYSPQLGSKKSGFLYGLNVKIGKAYGSGKLESYTPGSDGVLGSYNREDLNNLASQDDYAFKSVTDLATGTFHCGAKFQFRDKITIGVHGGVGLAIAKTEIDVSYSKVNNQGTRINYNFIGSGSGLGVTAHAEGYIAFYSFLYAAVGLDASAVGNIFGGSTPGGPLAARAQVGVRLPLLNFGSSLRALKP